MVTSFSKFFSGLTNSTKHSDFSSGNPSSSSYSYSQLVDQYHTPKCNKTNPKSPIKVTMKIESPPVMIYGSSNESSGDLFSGALILDIFPRPQQDSNLSNNATPVRPSKSNGLEPMISVSKLSNEQLTNDYVTMKEVKIFLIQITTYSKPFLPSSNSLQDCADCKKKIVELARWDVLTKKTAFAKGCSHSYPFSHLIPGSIPPTTLLSNSGTSIRYELVCRATYINLKDKEEIINLALPLVIRRSILREHDRNSMRIFPPTNVTAAAVIPNVVYPRSTFPVEIRMDHVSSKDRRWRMRKLNWKLEESIRVKANNCENHKAKFALTVDYTKKQQKNRKIYKNSGGLGNSTLNYFFEAPTRSAPRNNGTNENEGSNDADNSNAPDLTPFASNWSVTDEPTTSTISDNNDTNNSNNNANNNNQNSSSLDQMLASVTNQLPSNGQLENPDEVVLKQEDKSGLYIEEIRTLSNGELKSGWKSDFTGQGRIELVVEISVMNLISMGYNNANSNITTITSQNCDSPLFDHDGYSNNECNCSCDIEDHELGIFVSHNLILEIVVAEEVVQSTQAYSNRPKQSASSNTRNSSRPTHPLVPVSTRPNNQHSVSLTSTATTTTSTTTTTTTANTNGTSTTTSTESILPQERVGPDAHTGNKSDALNHTQGIPTGVARVLRMQFKIILTERSGLGVAWDDEVPPTYHTVGALSPPNYDVATSEPNTPLLSELVVPLEGDAVERTVVDIREPSLPSIARVHRALSGDELGNMGELHI